MAGIKQPKGGLTPRAHAADVAFRLLHGARLSCTQMAKEYGMSRQAAYMTLNDLSRVLPLISDRGQWYLMDSTQPPADSPANQPFYYLGWRQRLKQDGTIEPKTQ